MSIYQKLALIQQELIAPKGQRNDFGKYNYRSCEDIIQALKPLLDKQNCVVWMNTSMEEIGERVYVRADVHLIDLETDARISATAYAREEDEKKGMDGSQITGASLSYARKYALAGLFMIDNEKDSDATNNGKTEAKAEPKPKVINNASEVSVGLITPVQKVEILKELTRTHVPQETICKTYNVPTLDDIPEVRFEGLMKKLAKTPTWEAK